MYLNVSQFPPELLVTTDFAKTIQTSKRSSVSDHYLRPVQWVLTSSIDGPSNKEVAKHVIIISPFEANELFSDIQTSRAVVLHLYSPRQNRTFPALDKLDLYNTPVTNVELPMSCKIQLNLFAGQLYISSYDEYVAICAFLGVAAAGVPEGQAIAADGFIVASEGLSGTTFTQSPLKFLGILMSQFRKEGQKIDKTHVGKILDGKAISMDEFQVEDDNRSIVDDIL
ncbi:hypothetical protein N8T08_011188 [Aspergillus melleus]|uniref:Uncharacterized protein n=1 Tax=Aspergillus melleus TaxID=138277 RepID=A0ACC3AQ11_9EURO|nr:hypothetical protein N8T08_011188 [Aspergillus melleus]